MSTSLSLNNHLRRKQLKYLYTDQQTTTLLNANGRKKSCLRPENPVFRVRSHASASPLKARWQILAEELITLVDRMQSWLASGYFESTWSVKTLLYQY